MGLVGKIIYSDTRVDGYPLEGTAYYIYCDNCGSFNIRTHIKVEQWFMLILTMTIIAVCWNYFITHQNYLRNEQYGCWIIYLIFIIVIIGLLSPYFSHKCIKCGNTNITNKDVLNYSRYEDLNEIIDVPVFILHKHNEVEKNLINDLKVIPLFVLILLYVSLLPVIILVVLPTTYIYSEIKKKIGNRNKLDDSPR